MCVCVCLCVSVSAYGVKLIMFSEMRPQQAVLKYEKHIYMYSCRPEIVLKIVIIRINYIVDETRFQNLISQMFSL